MRLPLVLAVSCLSVPMIFGVATKQRASGTRNVSTTQTPATTTSREPDDLGPMPELTGGTRWINSAPISRADLAGKVVMIEIWTYGCYNCLNALPHIKETAAKYKSAGLVTIGVHTPEFDREKVVANVERRVRELGVEFPVVMDNDFAIWRAFNNRYWPAVYIVDKRGRIRFHHDGEGRYDNIDATVNLLLKEQ
jgi:thiol-disulfide isomerase/thioredoxin